MSQGQGSFQTNQRTPNGTPPPPAPPFALNSANNGLSVDPITFKIVLGQSVGAVGNPARLLNNRQIPLNGFFLEAINSGGFQWFTLDEPNLTTLIGPSTGTVQAFYTGSISAGIPSSVMEAADPGTTSFIRITSQTGVQEDIGISMQDPFNLLESEYDLFNQQVNVKFNAHPFFLLNFATREYLIGDFTGAAGGSSIRVADFLQTIEGDLGGDQYLLLDLPARRYQIGAQIAGQGNQSGLDIQDGVSTVILASREIATASRAELLLLGAAGTELASLFTVAGGVTSTNALDGVNGIWRAFSDGNGTFLRMSDFNQQVEAGNDNGGGTVIHYLKLDKINELYQIGDIDDSVNGTRIDIFNVADVVNIRNITHVLAEFDFSTGFPIVNLGDTNIVANGTILGVHDSTGELSFSNTGANAFVRINGTPGFSGTVAAPATITVDGGIVTNVA